jgi:myo-inositol-1(or 4)-monophosphatase
VLTRDSRHRPERAAAIEAVSRGLDLALSRDGADDIRSKGGRDLVTAADVAVEETVRSVLTAASGFPVIGEEGGGRAEPGTPYWLVDPICGTTNYAFGIPLFAVNVALVEDGEPVIGAVGDGSTGAILLAERGQGAFVATDGAWRPVAVNTESKLVVLEGWPRTGVERAGAARWAMDALRANRWDVRSFGTTLTLAHLAAGRVAACIFFAAPALHVAAGVALAREAGATVTDRSGLPWTVDSGSLIAAAEPELHRDLCEMVRETPVIPSSRHGHGSRVPRLVEGPPRR